MKSCSSKPSSPFSLRLIWVLLAGLALAGPAAAQNYSWTGAVNSSWANDANWTPGGFNLDILQLVHFDTISTQNLNTTLDDSFVIFGIAVGSPASDVTINTGTTAGALTFLGSGIDMTTATRNMTINAGFTTFGDHVFNVAAGRQLTLNGDWNTGLVGVQTVTGAGNTTVGGAIIGLGGMTKSGGGVLILINSGNTYSNGTQVLGGTLQLGQANVIPDSGAVTLNGGTLSTGATTGNSDIVGSLVLSGPSSIDLGSGAHTLTFNGLTYNSGTLTIDGWVGNGGGSGQEGQLIFAGLGSNPNSSFAAFLSNVSFTGYFPGGVFIASGSNFELVPNPIPEPATILGVATAGLAVGAVGRRFRRRYRMSGTAASGLS
jgi:autotransporter-associated beta strand protein